MLDRWASTNEYAEAREWIMPSGTRAVERAPTGTPRSTSTGHRTVRTVPDTAGAPRQSEPASARVGSGATTGHHATRDTAAIGRTDETTAPASRNWGSNGVSPGSLASSLRHHTSNWRSLAKPRSS
jgi:hypothetical protein